MFRSLARIPLRGLRQSAIRFASSYIPPRSPILSSLPPLSFSSSKSTSILQTTNLVPNGNEVTLKLPSINPPSSSSKLPNKELRISVEVEIVGDEIKFEIVDAGNNTDNIMHADSVLRKRRLKMKKHKYKKRRKAQRALRKRLGK
ncbi:hypothetical protein FOB58_003887 [Candida parapsilosis]|uniref:Small ribosomal subunit protein mS38 n=2 Tax=Candida parapsilosis TaxID=5480 RepID=G8B9L3_CANPC|nr:uncharacterized protein CPAR2_303030 [Candida parapsilosis]KAF6044249.1 hypothetical protein FOB60_005342 [Candida parapsilosis]KAF6047809.1 hypothetical protein FOB58_003887 [Candida parapsilosis]KAF6050223.1 hypothetical protein FOB59_002469 [Candida parapsilosis]KAF6061343.1 hypothetical protein FOB61_004100 [Candida parapsilosis]KAI5905012.1 hypothetical protein K4G60_g4170 [Candida parapsilosis]